MKINYNTPHQPNQIIACTLDVTIWCVCNCVCEHSYNWKTSDSSQLLLLFFSCFRLIWAAQRAMHVLVLFFTHTHLSPVPCWQIFPMADQMTKLLTPAGWSVSVIPSSMTKNLPHPRSRIKTESMKTAKITGWLECVCDEFDRILDVMMHSTGLASALQRTSDSVVARLHASSFLCLDPRLNN